MILMFELFCLCVVPLLVCLCQNVEWRKDNSGDKLLGDDNDHVKGNHSSNSSFSSDCGKPVQTDVEAGLVQQPIGVQPDLPPGVQPDLPPGVQPDAPPGQYVQGYQMPQQNVVYAAG